MTMFERFTGSARVAVVLAQEDARELEAREIKPEHLLVGVLQSSDHVLSTLLGGFGLTADAVRARLIAGVGADEQSFDEDAEALRSIGIDLGAVRDSVARNLGIDAFDNALHRSGRRKRRRGHIPFARSSKKALELALREAIHHGDREIRSEHLLLGILRGADGTTTELVAEHVPATQLRGAIVDLLDEAA
jgi:ATP-dependent Clp protease ATP-binding subunit ClpA